MANNADAIRVGATGKIYVAPVGTTAPTTATEALDAAFVDLGYVSTNGVEITLGKDVGDVNAWQALYPVRQTINGRTGSVSFELLEFNSDVLELALEATVTEVTGDFTITPAYGTTLDYRALIAEFTDGDVAGRFVVPKGLVVGDVGSKLVRDDAVVFPIEFRILGSDSGAAAYWLSDSAELA